MMITWIARDGKGSETIFVRIGVRWDEMGIGKTDKDGVGQEKTHGGWDGVGTVQCTMSLSSKCTGICCVSSGCTRNLKDFEVLRGSN